MHSRQVPDRLVKRRAPAAAAVVVVVLSATFFVFAQLHGGHTFDEVIHLGGLELQMHTTGRFLSGNDEASFRDLPRDLAFYGYLPMVSVHLAEFAGIIADASEETLATWRHYALHIVAFFFSLVTLTCVYHTISSISGRTWTAVAGTCLLAFYPLWIGHSFFDYKDIPTAAFFSLCTLATVHIWQSQDPDRLLKSLFLLLLGTVLIGGTKIAALALVMPSWAIAAYVLFQKRMLIYLPLFGAAAALGVIIITPVSWSDPIDFAIAAVSVMADHPWIGCTTTNGACINPQTEAWSALEYLYLWLRVQLPVLFIAGLCMSAVICIVSPRRPETLIWAMVLFPITIISAQNSTLYDALRHVLFLIPPIVVLVVLAFDRLWLRGRQARIPVTIGLLAQISLFVADNISLLPYNYAYFNLPGRQYITEEHYVTDYWGFSLREAARHPLVREGNAPIVSAEAHLLQPFLLDADRVLNDEQRKALDPVTPLVLVNIVRQGPPPEACIEVDFVERDVPLTDQPLHLSYVALCKAGDL